MYKSVNMCMHTCYSVHMHHMYLVSMYVFSFSATMTMRRKVTFRQGLEKFNNVDSNNDIYIYIYMYKTTMLCIYIYIHSLKWKHHARHSTKYNKNPVHDD